jgi:hypothetical protein
VLKASNRKGFIGFSGRFPEAAHDFHRRISLAELNVWLHGAHHELRPGQNKNPNMD